MRELLGEGVDWRSVIEHAMRSGSRDMRVPILGTAQDFVFPSSWFFDTRFHLNWIGRRPRTAKMIEILKAARLPDRW